MNKHLLIALCFLCNISVANEESVENTTTFEEAVIQAEEISEEVAASNQETCPQVAEVEMNDAAQAHEAESVETQITETEANNTLTNAEVIESENVDQEIINEEVAEAEIVDAEITEIQVVDTESSINSAFIPSSLVFDFVMELESLTEDWIDLMNSAKPFQPEENSTEKALSLAQAIYNHATSNQNNAHGSLSASLSSVDTAETSSIVEISAPNYIAIRLVITHNNELNADLWLTLQNLVLSAQQTAQATETASTENVDDIAQENPISAILNTVEKILNLAKEDNAESISIGLCVNAATNNTTE